jgi:hypothetical protein
MYVYGGVTLHVKNNTRVPADSEPGLLHAFNFATYTWSTIRTTGTVLSTVEQSVSRVDVSTTCVKPPGQQQTTAAC